MLLQVVDTDWCLPVLQLTGQDVTLRTCDQKSMQIRSETSSTLDALNHFRLSIAISASTTYCLSHPISGGDACSVASYEDKAFWTKYYSSRVHEPSSTKGCSLSDRKKRTGYGGAFRCSHLCRLDPRGTATIDSHCECCIGLGSIADRSAWTYSSEIESSS